MSLKRNLKKKLIILFQKKVMKSNHQILKNL